MCNGFDSHFLYGCLSTNQATLLSLLGGLSGHPSTSGAYLCQPVWNPNRLVRLRVLRPQQAIGRDDLNFAYILALVNLVELEKPYRHRRHRPQPFCHGITAIRKGDLTDCSTWQVDAMLFATIYLLAFAFWPCGLHP